MKTRAFLLLLMLMVPMTIGLSSAKRQNSRLHGMLSKDYFLDVLTIYNPEEGQCDDSPLITANNSHIDIDKLRRNEIRWMALSRDQLKRWHGDFDYGDTVLLDAGDSKINGLWVINDNMNKRYKNRGDLLFHRDSRTTGLWKKVKINRWEHHSIAG